MHIRKQRHQITQALKLERPCNWDKIARTAWSGTSPVGVVVLDARTGKAVSLNRVAKRILRGLQMPGNSAKEPLETMTCRRDDGREVGLAELSLARQLGAGETGRAEEVELSVADGRSMTTLVSTMPIQAKEGGRVGRGPEQDLAPLEELERMTAEFLGIVGHELRGPLTSIKGSAATVFATPRGITAVEMLEFFRIIDEQVDHMSRLIGDLLDRGRLGGRIRAASDGESRGARLTLAVPPAAEEAGNGAADSVPEGPSRPGRDRAVLRSEQARIFHLGELR